MPDPQSTVNAPMISIGSVMQKADETDYVLNFVMRSDQKRVPYIPTWREVLDNYLVTPFTDRIDVEGFATGRRRIGQLTGGGSMSSLGAGSTLKDPETHQIIERLSQQGLQLLLNSRDFIQVTPVGGDDPEKARLLAKLLMSILEMPGVWRTHYQLFKNAFLFGTSYLEIGWETRTRQQVVPIPRIDDLGQLEGIELIPDEVLYRDRPLMREIDIFDAYPDPSGTRIQEDMTGFAKRFRITRAKAMELAKEGVYDMEDVKKAINDQITGDQQTSNFDDIGGPRKWPDLESELPDRLAVLNGFEYWGHSPIETSDGISNRVITLLNGHRVRSRINGWLDGDIPIKEIVMNPVGGRHYGLGPAEVVRFLQDSADSFLMNFTDAANAAVRGPLLVGNTWSGDETQLRQRRLLDVIRCGDVKQVAPVPTDLPALEYAMVEMARRKQMMREATGATDPLQAIPSGGEKTATEVSTLVQIASQKVDIMVQLVERDDYPWIGRTLHSRIKQFVAEGGAIASLAGEVFEVPFSAIDISADVRFIGSRQAQTRFQKTAALREAINVLGQNPDIAMVLPELVERYLRDGLEIVDAKEIIQAMLKRLLLRQIGQARAAQAGQAQAVESGRQGSAAGPGGEEDFGTQAGETERQGEAIVQ